MKASPRSRPAPAPGRRAAARKSPPAEAPAGRSRRSEATRTAILQAALQIFSERGFEASSTRDIAAYAGAHHALIKYHFGSKEALWRAAVTFMFERQAAEMTFERPPEHLKTRQARRDFARESLRRYVLYCARHPEHARLMTQENLRDSERMNWMADQFVTGAVKRAERLVLMLQQEGMLPKASVPALIYIMAGSAQLYYTLAPEVRRVWGFDPTDVKATSDHIDALLAVLLR